MGVIAGIFVVVVVVLHLSGHGMNDHGMNGHGMGDHGMGPPVSPDGAGR